MTADQHGIWGIDLGTTYSVVGYIDDAGRAAITRNNYGLETTPSVVYFENESSVVVGQTAKEAAGEDPANVVSLIKREMGAQDFRLTFHGVDYTAPSISSLILQRLAQEAAESTGRAVSDVVITVPAYFGLLERDATRLAGEMAGLKVIGIVPEPVAAALHYGMTGSADGRTVLVFDLGGGTFDVSIIRIADDRIEVMVVGGNHRLGGADWDSRLLGYIVDEVVAQVGGEALRDDEKMLADLRVNAEKVKQVLSVAESKTFQVRYTGAPARVTVTRAQFEEMTRDLLEETVRITKITLADAETKYPGLTGEISSVLLVGGSSYMPAVAAALKREFGWDPKLNDPNLAVAKGAALYAAARLVDGGWWRDEPVKSTGSNESPVDTEARLNAVAERTHVDPERLREMTKRTIVNVLPKAVGVKVLNADVPGWDSDDNEHAFYIQHLVEANTQLPTKAEPYTPGTAVDRQDEIEVELWEQAGAIAAPELEANVRVQNGSGHITGLGQYELPAGSPVHIELSVTEEGTVQVRAFEPRSGKELKISVRISALSEEQVEKEKEKLRVLTARG